MSRERDSGQLEQLLRSYRAPDETAAAERGLRVVRAAFVRAEAGTRGRRPLRLLAVSILALLLAGVALSPAGAAVRDLIEGAITVEKVAPAPLRLPADGSILTVDDEGAWIASEDGGRRYLGLYRQAAYSPRGLNVVVTAGRELSAVDQRGELQWRLGQRRRVSDPAWAPSALRIAYRAGAQLRLVEGDGSPDRGFAERVAPVAPAWRPIVAGEEPRDVIAYAERSGGVRIRDAVEEGPGVTLEVEGRPRLLQWLDSGRLVVVGSRAVELFARDGARLARVPLPADAAPAAVVSQPGTARIALGLDRFGSDGATFEVRLIRLEPDRIADREVFSSSGTIGGLAFSPDGAWLGFGWPGGDSWLFLRPLQRAKLVRETEAVAAVSSYFREEPASGQGFPQILDWQLPQAMG